VVFAGRGGGVDGAARHVYGGRVILVDALRAYPKSRWPDRLWCHMVSDHSLEELHEMAAALGVPPRGFHRDHYDLDAPRRAAAVARGAVEVGAKELVLRMFPARPSIAARRPR